MNINRIIQLAALAGRIILENGGEVFRVEETVNKICESYGIENCQTYATITALIVSAPSDGGDVCTVVERILSRCVNLDKVDAVNRLSREFQSEMPDIGEAMEKLAAIKARKQYGNKTIVLFSAIACAAFTALFGGSVYDLLPAFAVGAVIRLAMISLARIRLNDFFINVTGGLIATVGGRLFVAAIPAGNIDAIISSTIMLLVPGLMVTNAIRDMTAGDIISSISRFMEAFFIAIAIACGTALGHIMISAWRGLII